MRRLTMILAALTLVVAACGDDDDGSAAPADDEAVTAPTTAPAGLGAEDETDDGTSPSGEAEVSISDFSFQPDRIDVGAGATVTWTNDDGVPHTVTAGTADAVGDTFDEPVEAGQTAEVTFDEAGTYDYFCAIHPTMTGQVVVS
ncbi:MAG TPA: plastocyanin/azurin family copper-binding protein [Acidimicrobiales bacterium]|nr:plastocyanin/azurin family copper-binding protein [Acidimicrobiales bacterium]